MHFGENQLSRSLIGLSPLPTAHPLSLQPKWVRASTTSYHRFTLAMGRSPRFGSRTRHYTAPFGLAFATTTPHGLTSRHATNSQAHFSIGTPSPATHTDAQALTACRHTVSGTISLPSRGTFHHSLTVLSTIGHYTVFRLTGWSRQIHSRFHEPAATRGHAPERHTVFSDRTLTFYGRPSQTSSPNRHVLSLPASTAAPAHTHPTTPHTQPLPSLTCAWFSLIHVRSPLLAESHIVLFSRGY